MKRPDDAIPVHVGFLQRRAADFGRKYLAKQRVFACCESLARLAPVLLFSASNHIEILPRHQFMHASQLAQIGSWIAVHAPTLIFGNSGPEELVSVDYWTTSKCRIQRWNAAMDVFEQDLWEGEASHDPWPAISTVVEEILVSEFLTRIWSAAVMAHDTYQESDELYGLAHSIHISHMEARNRAMRMLLGSQALNEKEFDRLNLLRRKVERWTDLFLARVTDISISGLFAFDSQRVEDFHDEIEEMSPVDHSRRNQMLMASFTAELSGFQSQWAANPELNRKISSSLLACFPSDRFDSLGLPKSFGMVLLEKTQHDTQLLVDRLLELDDESIDLTGNDELMEGPHFLPRSVRD